MDNLERIKKESSISEEIKINGTRNGNGTINCRRTDLGIWNQFRVEPFVFILMFSFAMRRSVYDNMIKDGVCQYYYNFTNDICSNLSFFSECNDEVQGTSSIFLICVNLIDTVPGCLMALFIGGWGDKHGRRLPILVGVFGLILEQIGLIYYTLHPGHTWNMLLAAIPAGLFGGLVNILSSSFSYLAEITSVQTRTARFGFINFCFYLSLALGGLIGGQIFTNWGYVPIFCTVLVCQVICVVWVWGRIVNRRSFVLSVSKWQKLKDIFDPKTAVDCWRASTVERPNHGRTVLWMLMFGMLVVMLNVIGTSEIALYYTQKVLDWSVGEYSTVNSISSIVISFIMILAVRILVRRLKMRDSVIGIIAMISMAAQSFLTAFTKFNWMYYTALLLGSLTLLCSVSIRSAISKIIDKEETGKVFAMLSFIESMAPIFGSFLLNGLYSATVSFFPGLAFLVSGFTLIFPFGCFATMFILENRASKMNGMKIPEPNGNIQTEDEDEPLLNGVKS